MANIKDTRSKLHDKIGKGFDIPSEHVESEGERLIKCLSEKQTNTKISLSEELKREQSFQKSQFLPITTFLAGQINLDKFQEIHTSILSLEFLYSCDLNTEEVNLYNDSLKGFEYLKTKYKNLEPNVLTDRLDGILKKIESAKSHEQKCSEPAKPLQQYELGTCVKPNSNETKLYKFALSCKPTNRCDNHKSLDHPINNLKNIEKDLFPKSDSTIPPIEKRRKRARKILDSYKPTVISKNTPVNVSNSKWDIKEEGTIVKKVKLMYTCEPFKSNLPAVKQETATKVVEKGIDFVAPSNCSLVSLEHINKYRLSLPEIKQFPIFKNYEPGSLNNVLFVKNLSIGVTISDLSEIFGNFQQKHENKILYKIMGGKMKGQAFITFHSVASAKAALEAVNGYLLDGKPIILQYARGKSS